MSYTDALTIDELKEFDDSMVDDAIKNAHRYEFKTVMAACGFVYEAVRAGLRYAGVVAPPNHDEISTHYYSDDKRIRIENRDRHYKGGDAWRNGVYIYRDDVLVSFISKPLTYSHPLMPIEKVQVITNAPIERGYK